MTGSWENGAAGPDETSMPPALRGAAMADRVPFSITIGGSLPADRLDELIDIANSAGLSPTWDGGPLTVDHLPVGTPLKLHAHEVANGQIDDIEDFCCNNDLPFVRWSGAAPGSFPAEIVVWVGEGPRRSFTADDDEHVVLTTEEAEKVQSLDDLKEHFETGSYVPPPLEIVNPKSE